MAKEIKKAEPITLQVNGGTIMGSTYSQVVNVTVTNVDMTLEFIYINPHTRTNGQVVARITLPLLAGENLAKTINQTIMQHQAKKKGAN